MYEFAAELTYPVSEGSSAALLSVGENLGTLFLLQVLAPCVDPEVSRLGHTCNVLKLWLQLWAMCVVVSGHQVVCWWHKQHEESFVFWGQFANKCFQKIELVKVSRDLFKLGGVRPPEGRVTTDFGANLDAIDPPEKWDCGWF